MTNYVENLDVSCSVLKIAAAEQAIANQFC